MKCTNCGYETQASAKFCVQCGTTLPAAPAAPAAEGSATVISAAPKAAAPPSPAPASPSSTQRMAAATYAPTPAPTSPASTASGVSPPAVPRRVGLIAGLVGALAVLCVGGFMAYKMFLSDDSKSSVATTEPKAEGAATQPADASKDGGAPGATQSATGPDNNMSTQQSPAAGPEADASKAATAAAGAAGTPQATPGGAASKAGAAAAKVDPAAAAKTATPSPVAAPAPATPPRQTAAAATTPATHVDHWEQMRQAYEVCNRESLFDRLACNQRVGQQFCKGYWGLVPQCPAGQYGERAN